jgi:hypothetical protein
MVSLEIFIDIILPHYGPGLGSASNSNEYQDYFLGVGRGVVGLTTLPPICADYHEILKPQAPGTLHRPGLCRDIFTFILYIYF